MGACASGSTPCGELAATICLALACRVGENAADEFEFHLRPPMSAPIQTPSEPPIPGEQREGANPVFLAESARKAARDGDGPRVIALLDALGGSLDAMAAAILAANCLFDAADAEAKAACALLASRMVEKGVPFEIYDEDVVFFAVREGRHLAVEALLAAGADPLRQNSQGLSALMLAAERGHAECLRALLPVSDPNQTDNNGGTALMWAATRDMSFECFEILLPISNVSIRDSTGLNALGWAVACDQWPCVSELLPRCEPADILERGEHPSSPMELAAEQAQNGRPGSLDILGPWLAGREALAIRQAMEPAQGDSPAGQMDDTASAEIARRNARRM